MTLAGAPGNNTLSGFNIGNCTGFAIQGANVGTLAVSTLSINNTAGGGLDLTGVATPTVSVVLGGLTSTGGTKNVNLVGLNGTITLANGALSGASGNAVEVSGAGNAARIVLTPEESIDRCPLCGPALRIVVANLRRRFQDAHY